MEKCISCGKSGAEHLHFNGGYVCNSCVGKYFTCPNCGRLFDNDDYKHGDTEMDFVQSVHLIISL